MDAAAIEKSALNVLVTGGHGFLGSHVVDALRIHGFARIFTPRSADYDLVDKNATEALFESNRFDIVIHCAARAGGIGLNRARPGTLCYDNLMMGANVIHAAMLHHVSRLVIVGTVCSYPKYAPVPFREEDLWSGYPEETNAPYGLAKKMLIVQAQAYRAEYGLNAAIVLPTNLYGPRDNFRPLSSHVVPAIIKKVREAMERGEELVTLWGDGTPTRDFLYVEDAAEGVVRVAETIDHSAPINLGSGREVTMMALARMIGDRMGFQGLFAWNRAMPNGQPRRALDTARAADLIGFRPRVSLEEGLQRTVYWYAQEGHRGNGIPC